MSRVIKLPDDLVSLISAGEVIENPSSIVKELIENSLDAESKNIEIEITDGGIKQIRVSDDGSGIHPDDCGLCIQRYSTSKISSRLDIETIHTYGFRGEALASIASVADLSIKTRFSSFDSGNELVSRQGESPILSEISRPVGTTIEVTNLFSQVPARRKHLDSVSTEGYRIHEVIMKHAIIRNDVGFRFIRDGEIIIDVPKNQSRRERVLDIWGLEIAKSLVEISFQDNNISITGFIVRPPTSRGNRQREYFSIRKRPIQESKFSLAVESAYSTLLMTNRYPICALDIDIDVERVDANVHPTKREVRIDHIDEIVKILKEVVKDSLSPSSDHIDSSLQEYVETIRVDSTQTIEERKKELVIIEEGLLTPGSIAKDETMKLGGVFRIIGQVSELYLLVEMDGDLVIIDQHAAHERILYEQLRERVNKDGIIVQELLEPIVIRLDKTSLERIIEVKEQLETLGFSISEFGGNEILISSVPDVLGRRANENDLIALVDRIIELGPSVTEKFMDEMVRLTACHAAIRAGEKLDINQIRELIVDLSKTKNQNYCCHGRPSIVKVTRGELDKRFGRDGVDALKRFHARHRKQ